MDVAKYIGLFLLKNHFCYIHGLGNLEMKKKPATHNGETLTGPAYEVMVTPGGSIDDSLANFIATNEQISISKAANALREFSTEAKATLQAGKEVIIPSVGNFVEVNGRFNFITDPHLQYTPRNIPTIKTAVREVPVATAKNISYNSSSTSSSSGGSVQWGKVAAVVLFVAVCIAGVVLFINYTNQQKEEQTVDVLPVEDTMQQQAVVADTTAAISVDSTTAPSVVTGADGSLNLKVILNTFTTNARAEKRMNTLTGYGNKVEVIMKDSTTYHVVMPITVMAADTTRVLDSLRRTFSPKGVSIYR